MPNPFIVSVLLGFLGFIILFASSFITNENTIRILKITTYTIWVMAGIGIFTYMSYEPKKNK